MVSNQKILGLAISVLMLPMFPSVGHAQFGFRHREPRRVFHVVDVGAWHRGHWFHGDYGGRAGWWFIVGSSWHFYSQPVYPYPDPNVAPVYIVEVPAASAPQASTIIVTQAAPAAPQPTQVVVTQAAPVPAPAVQVPGPSQMPVAMADTTAVQPGGQPAAQPVAAAQPTVPPGGAQFYYCSSPQGYYPNVPNCPGGWAVTPAGPPH